MSTSSNTQEFTNTLLTPIKTDIQNQIAMLNLKSPKPHDIIKKYEALNTRATEIETNQSGSDYITISSKISTLQSDLTTLNMETKRAVRKGGEGLMGDIFEEIKLINSDLFILTSTLVGMLFGGIVSSNWHVGNMKQNPPVEPTSIYPQVKILFYFIYGAVLFPLALLYGALMDTPAWRAILIPLFEVPMGFYNPLISYRPKMNILTYSVGKNVLRLVCYILLICLAGTIYLINFNE